MFNWLTRLFRRKKRNLVVTSDEPCELGFPTKFAKVVCEIYKEDEVKTTATINDIESFCPLLQNYLRQTHEVRNSIIQLSNQLIELDDPGYEQEIIDALAECLELIEGVEE